ncbi:MAG TPA: nitrite reductase, partial [Cytophagales bacterium]|nr:nitrite reductase [Cytophagales bacterium]
MQVSPQPLSAEAQRDITELREEIARFRQGGIDEDRFKAFRLTRGVYGQRQPGVQMVRIKLPYGRVTGQQLHTIADLAQEYGHGNLHFTTRQNIQLHHVNLDETPDLWTKLEQVGITLRASCGNTVRNLTGSPLAGVDPQEAFDITPYAHAAFEYFLRHPVGWEMGRKIKIAFSASDKDSAFTYIHDFGFTPVIRNGVMGPERGFKVVVGGGLGAQAILAQKAFEFLPEEHLIPFLDAALRIFDRYGERERRHKARLKFLIKDWGIDEFLALVAEEQATLGYTEYPIVIDALTPTPRLNTYKGTAEVLPEEEQADYRAWTQHNVVAQKQAPWYAVKVRVPLGNLDVPTAHKLADILSEFSGDDTRLSVNQGLILRYVHPEALPVLYLALKPLGLSLPGFDTLADVTSCPGSDTCNLAVTNATRLATQLEEVVRDDFPELIGQGDAHIKISGCMNACGQHMIAAFGLHGSSIKYGKAQVIPAQQVVLGGGVQSNGEGRMGDKIIKLPTKRIPEALRRVLLDYTR